MGKRLRKKKKKNKKHKQKRQTSNSILEDAKESVSEKSRDFISNLPDEILSNILSCLPFNSAVRTSILSSRWRSLLNNCLADLIVDEARTVLHGTIEEIPSAISGLLRSNSTSWDFFLFMLRPYGWHNFGNMRFLRFHFCQTKILQAITKRDGKLHLDFSKGHNPSSHFDWHLELPFSIIYFHSSEFSFVKTLSIRSVCFLTKDLVSILFTKFICLQSLSIAECNGLQSLHIDAYCKLESLTVINCPKLNNVHLSSYMLKTLRIRGLLPWFSISYTPYLADAMLDFRGGPAYRPLCRENLLSLLLSLKNVEILTVTGWIFQVTIPRWLPSAGVIFERKDFWFFNLKELWWIDSSMERKQMDALIFFLKLCPYLERLFIHIDPMCYQIPNASTSAIDNNAANSFWMDYTKRVASDVRLNHLKIIKIMGLSNQEDEMLLVDCLLKEVVGVEPMIIAKSQEGRPARLLKKQWWRRCKKSLRIVETKNDYRIIEVENGSDLHPRHAHVSSFV